MKIYSLQSRRTISPPEITREVAHQKVELIRKAFANANINNREHIITLLKLKNYVNFKSCPLWNSSTNTDLIINYFSPLEKLKEIYQKINPNSNLFDFVEEHRQILLTEIQPSFWKRVLRFLF